MRFAAVAWVTALVAAGMAQAQLPTTPAFSKSFGPTSIGPGSATTLVYTIDGSAIGLPVTDLAFQDSLPANLAIATPSRIATTCVGATVAGAPGGSTITLTQGRLSAGSRCTVTVDVTSSVPDTYPSTSGDLTSSGGNSGTAQDTLTVDASLPGFSLSVSPATILSVSRTRAGSVGWIAPRATTEEAAAHGLGSSLTSGSTRRRSSTATLPQPDDQGKALVTSRLRTKGERGMAGLRASGGDALVVPIRTAGLADLNDLADLRRLHRPPLREIDLQGLVAAPAVVAVKKVASVRRQTCELASEGPMDGRAPGNPDSPTDLAAAPGCQIGYILLL
jgi:hypothetical protein